MNIVNFLLSNWDSVFIVLLVVAAIVFLIVRKQYPILDKIIYALVTEAQRKYGADNGTGTTKLAEVMSLVYPKIPAVIRIFLTAKQLQSLIERVLNDAKAEWERNPLILARVEKPPDVRRE